MISSGSMVHLRLTKESPYMYTKSMILTGYIEICIFRKEFPNWVGIYSLGIPSTGIWCAGWLSYRPLSQTSIGGKTCLNGCP